jgi:lipopolysaccharide transport system permease protein
MQPSTTEGALVSTDWPKQPPAPPSPPAVVIQARTGFFDLDLRAIWEYRELVYFMVWRDVKSRYKQTVLGVSWAVLQPALTMVVFWVIFSLFARVPSDNVPYPLFAFIGLVPWTYFSQAVARGANGLIGNSHLIGKVYFPRLIILLAAVFTPAIDFVLSLGLLAVLMVWYGVVPTFAALAIVPLFLLALAAALAAGTWLSALNAKYRDIGQLIPFLVQIWMYASPVIYPLSLVPERWQRVYSWNPMVGVITGFRWALVGGQPPDWVMLFVSCIGVALLLVSGLMYFRRTERELADVI